MNNIENKSKRDILKLLENGNTPMDIISQGKPKNKVYDVYGRYSFLNKVFEIYDMVEDAVMRMSTKEFKEFKESWSDKSK